MPSVQIGSKFRIRGARRLGELLYQPTIYNAPWHVGVICPRTVELETE